MANAIRSSSEKAVSKSAEAVEGKVQDTPRPSSFEARKGSQEEVTSASCPQTGSDEVIVMSSCTTAGEGQEAIFSI